MHHEFYELVSNKRMYCDTKCVLYRSSESQLIFNFTCLDSIIQVLHDYELMPGFEMMGNPSNHFTDFEDHSQIVLFADLAFQLASRYIGLNSSSRFIL